MFDLSLTNENLIVLGGFGSGLVAATAVFVALFALTNRYFRIVKEQTTSPNGSSTNSEQHDTDSNQQRNGESSAHNSSSTWTKEDQEKYREWREEQERLRNEREEQERARRQREEQERTRRQREEWERYRRERESRNAKASTPPPKSEASKPHPFEKEYSILGLQPGASRLEVRRAWAKKVKQVHPDVDKSPDAGDKFKELHKAYETLLRIMRK